jgi:hypothetical protein
MESSSHSLIHFLPLFCNCQFRKLDSIQFLCSQAYILAGWRPETRLFTPDYCASILPNTSYNHFAPTTHKTQRLFLRRRLLISCLAMDVLLLRSLAPAGMCLPNRCQATGLYVTIYSQHPPYQMSPVQWTPGALFIGIKRLGREASHTPQSSVEIKMSSWRNAQLSTGTTLPLLP